MVMLQILLDGAEPRDAGTTQLSSPVSCTYKQTHIKLCESVELLGHIRSYEHTRDHVQYLAVLLLWSYSGMHA